MWSKSIIRSQSVRRRRKEVVRVRIVGRQKGGKRRMLGGKNGGEGSMVRKRKWWVGGRPRRRMGRSRMMTKGLKRRRSVQRVLVDLK